MIVTTSDLFNSITDSILLSPSAEYELKNILKQYDGKIIKNDFYEEDKEEQE